MQMEINALLQLTNGNRLPAWVAATRTSNSLWKWSNGITVSSTFWAIGEPSIYGDCATLRAGSNPGMTACPCYNQQPALCKLKPDLCNGGQFGGVNIRSGSINSAGFPNQYYNNLDCYHQIEGPPGTYITITFDTFIVENLLDYVEVYNGNSTAGALIGDMDRPMPSQTTFESTSNQMLVYFHTDSMITDKGWSAQWRAKPNSPAITQSGSDGVMSSPNYPSNYDPFAEQMYYINADQNSRIFATFDTFRTEDNVDYLEVYDGGDMQSKLLANFSGSSLNENTLQTTGNTMTMRFMTDGAMQYFGWHMYWTTD